MFRVMRPTSKSDNRAITPEVVIRASIKMKTKQIEALKRSESNKEALEAAELDLQRASELAQQLEQHGSADFSDNSFQHPLYLSPNHTLHLETYAYALAASTHSAQRSRLKAWSLRSSWPRDGPSMWSLPSQNLRYGEGFTFNHLSLSLSLSLSTHTEIERDIEATFHFRMQSPAPWMA